MKATFISSHAISEAMRYQMMRMQADLVKAEKEIVTGRVADPGLALGARTSQSVSLARDVGRLTVLLDSNGLVQARLASSQEGLNQIRKLAEGLMPSLTTAASGPMDPTVPQTEAKATLNAITAILNTAQNGEYLFAGINTDIKPINDFFAPGSPARTAFDAAFVGHFGFAIDDPATAGITAADMDIFIDTVVEPQFFGPDWNTNWSNATDQQIVSRITLSETTPASVSANTDGIRKLAMATAMVSVLMDAELTEGVRGRIMERSVDLVGQAVADLGALQGQIGIIQQRVEGASERVSMQIDLFKLNIHDLEGVDPFEASTRISSLMTQIETSYTLTARIQQLSLVRFLR
jgi:flagellar hook-associated protein 3 FlgL